MVGKANSLKRMGILVAITLIPMVVLSALILYDKRVAAGPQDSSSTVDLNALQSNAAGRPDYVLRFDPELESFEVFTLPTQAANPHGVLVSANLTSEEVWFTERDADQIGRLVYTATGDYAFYEYPLAAGSEPLDLAQDGSYIWFTARSGNYIGRIEISSSQLVTFTGLTPDSRPSGIGVAPDGSVWFAEMGADKIGRLVITTTSDYRVEEYPIPLFTGRPETSAPYGIYVHSNDAIWFSETERDQLVRFQPSVYPFDPKQAFAPTGPTQNGEGHPLNLVYDSATGRLWFTELLGNYVTLFILSTTSFGLQYTVPTTDSRPYDLAIDSTGQVWFTENRAAKLGRLVLGSSVPISEYPLPLANALPTGVAVDDDDKVWTVVTTWHQVYLPVVFNYYPPPTPPFGIQTYWAVDNAYGLQEMQDADTQWLRLLLSWSAIEPVDTTPESFNWATYDNWFRNLQAAGIRPVVMIQGNPSWAAQYSAGPIYPEHMDDFLEFVGALVERYDGDGVDDAAGSPVVNHWEFYNEVDNGSVLLAEAGYGYWGHNGAGYADLLRQAWPVIKAASPQARVLNGGLAYERFEETEGGPYVRQFLDDFLAAGGGDYIDVFNFHFYPSFAQVWAPYGRDVIGKTTYLRNLLAGYGVYKPVACTELGTHSDPSRGGSYESQSRYVVQGFVRSMSTDLDIVIWFVLRDITEGFPYLYGLLDDSYGPKPAYYAFDTLTAHLTGARYERTLTVQETGADAVEGYVMINGAQKIYIVWTNDEATYSLNVPADSVERVDKFGSADIVLDSYDGSVDGVVTLDVGPSPMYLRFEP